ncbi:MAG: ferredoxin reductase family protein [Dehalococcoidia bacterium]|jgi:predicted ferric reductase
MIRIRDNLGWSIIIVLSLVPLLFWYNAAPLSLRFSNNTLTLLSLGQMAGLVGMSMFALTVIMSARLRIFEGYFGGMNKVYASHHVLGAVAFTLILFHPLLLAARLLSTDSRSAALLLLPSGNWAINLGILALLSLLALVLLTFFVTLPYDSWELTHKLMGAAFLFAVGHSFFIQSDISRDTTLRLYVLGLAGIAIAVYAYRTLLGRMLVPRYEYRVESVKSVNDRVVAIEMTPRSRALRFLPGQFVFVQFFQRGISTEAHPFSLTSVPKDGRLRIVVKSLGDYTSRLQSLRRGAVARIEGPFGKFSYHNCPNKKQVWIAGGIGVTPFLSMAGTLERSDYSVDLYYSANSEDEAIFLDELLALAEGSDCLRVIPYFADAQGFLTARAVAELSGGLADKDIFLCGPPAMMRGLTAQFTRMRVKYHRIHSDEFKLR